MKNKETNILIFSNVFREIINISNNIKPISMIEKGRLIASFFRGENYERV